MDFRSLFMAPLGIHQSQFKNPCKQLIVGSGVWITKLDGRVGHGQERNNLYLTPLCYSNILNIGVSYFFNKNVN